VKIVFFKVKVLKNFKVPLMKTTHKERQSDNKGTDLLAVVKLESGTFSEEHQRRPGILKHQSHNVSYKRERTLSFLRLSSCLPCSVRLY